MPNKIFESETSFPIIIGTGDKFWDSSLSEAEKCDLIHLGISLGVTLIDTAEGYGNSEETVGRAVKNYRHSVKLATKVSPSNLSYEDVIVACDRSLARLGTDYIDLYQVHWPSAVIPIEETMEAMKILHKAGKIRGVGLCNYTMSEILKAEKALGAVPLSALQMEYNVFERTIETNGQLDFCSQNGRMLLAYSPLDQGQTKMLSPQQLLTLEELGRKYDKTPQQIILRFLTSAKNVFVITRTTSKQHMKENIAAIDFELSEEEVQSIRIAFPIDVHEIIPNRIKVSVEGEWNHAVYQTLDDAIKNEHGFSPSPTELSEWMKQGELLKPVRLIPSSDPLYEYELVAGRIRYWAWVIAHGMYNRPIPAYIRTAYGD